MENSTYSGKFRILPDIDVIGNLTIAGPNSFLHVWSDKSSFIDIDKGTVTGDLYNLKKVSLINCAIRMHESFSGNSEAIYHHRVYPGLIVIGNEYLLPNDREIAEVNFTFDDATTLFYDRDAFGIVDRGGNSLMEKIGELENRKIETGPRPTVAYFSGKFDIVSVDTPIGKISVSRIIGEGFDHPSGVRIENQITIKIKFPELANSDHAIQSVVKLLRLFEIITGRPQNITHLSFFKGEEERLAERFEAIQCNFPIYERSDEERSSNIDVLINPIQHEEEFSRIIVNWLDHYETWEDAYSRFFNGFFKQGSYDIDRLVGAANMFDILPDTALPPRTEIPEELKSAIDRCRNVIKKFPSSPERESILNDLGRVRAGKNVLKKKIRHRAQILVDVIRNDLPEIFCVIDEAVNCRNHYVHGSPLRIESSKIDIMLIFFTMTLEFVFAASDLVEAGWNPKTWSRDARYYHHPFYRYLISYRTSLERLKSSMKPSD